MAGVKEPDSQPRRPQPLDGQPRRRAVTAQDPAGNPLSVSGCATRQPGYFTPAGCSSSSWPATASMSLTPFDHPPMPMRFGRLGSRDGKPWKNGSRRPGRVRRRPRSARADRGRGVLQAVGIAAGEDDIGPFGPGAPGRPEPDACAAVDHRDGLSGPFRFALAGNSSDCAGHGSSGGWPGGGSPGRRRCLRALSRRTGAEGKVEAATQVLQRDQLLELHEP
jgi:hypothetical protein